MTRLAAATTLKYAVRKGGYNWLSMIATRVRAARLADGGIVAPSPAGNGGDQP